MRMASVSLAVLLLTACSPGSGVGPGANQASLEDIGFHPENYEIGRRVAIEGWLIKPPRSVLFVCDEIGDESPPRAVGSCSEVESEELLRSEDAITRGGTTWIPNP